MATAVVLMMATLAPAPLMARPVSVDYNPISDDMDAEGEDDPEVEISMGKAVAGQIQDKIEEPDQLVKNRENNQKAEEHVEDAEKSSQRHVESEEVIEDDLSKADESSAEEDRDFDKGSSGSESAVLQEWDGGSDGGDDDAEVEVANRNNCVLVFSR